MYQLNSHTSFKSCLFTLALLLVFTSKSQTNTVKIVGFAPDYIGKEISFNQIEDYYSNIESTIGKTTVKKDSTFSAEFHLDHTQRIVVRGLNNKGWMYVEPGAKYDVFYPNKSPNDPVIKTGNQVEIKFFNLEPTDINYKILAFQRWTDEYMARYFDLKFKDPARFGEKLDTFKMYVEKAYKQDSSIYFLNFVKFSMAQLDEIAFIGTRNRFEKYDFYIKPSAVYYENDAYMNYIMKYYADYIPRLSNEVNNEVYLGVVKSSPTAIMKALGSDYALKNLRLREMVMIQALSEVYYSDDFPQTNINTILDSLSKKCLFRENEIIAKNVFYRLTELVPGGKSPAFVLFKDNKVSKTYMDYKGKHLYIHFYDPKSPNNQKELVLLKDMHKKYINDLHFLTIAIDNGDLLESEYNDIQSIQWDVFSMPATDDFIKKFRITNYPSYVLIDPQGYIVGAPALGPTPNAQYQTIDQTFYYIHKVRQEQLDKR